MHVAVSVGFGVWEGGEGRIILTWKSGMSGALLGEASQPKVFGFPKSACSVEIHRLASRKANSSGNFLPSPGSVAITVCVGDFQWANSVIGVAALTGGMMRPEVEVAPEEVLWDRGVATATAYRWVRKTNHSLPYNSTM